MPVCEKCGQNYEDCSLCFAMERHQVCIRDCECGCPPKHPGPQRSEGPCEASGSAEYLRNLKTKLIEGLKATELDDGQELCPESERLILGWIDVWFENKIYDDGLEANSQ